MRLVGLSNNVTSGREFRCVTKSNDRPDRGTKCAQRRCRLQPATFSHSTSTTVAAEIGGGKLPCRHPLRTEDSNHATRSRSLPAFPSGPARGDVNSACRLGSEEGSRTFVSSSTACRVVSRPNPDFQSKITGCRACFGYRPAPQPSTVIGADPSARRPRSDGTPSRGATCNKLSGCN